MANVITPTIYDFNVFDATQTYYISYSANGASGTFSSIQVGITNITEENININKFIEITKINMPIEEYLKSMGSIGNQINMVYYQNIYYLIIYKNFLKNGNKYSLEVSFFDISEKYPMDMYGFECHSSPILALESYKYPNTEDIFVDDGVKEITIIHPTCLLNFSYTQNDGDALKYYYFQLYNNNKLLGYSQKIYASSDITYGVENYNNLQTYKLILCCFTQSGVSKQFECIINTKYNKESVYADITFDLDKEYAENNISISVTQLNGNGENYSFITENSNTYVTIQDNGYVEFIDTHQMISKNFLCRLWCRNLKKNSRICKIEKTSGNEYVEIFFTGNKFVAYKNSCDLITSYISNYLTENDDIGADADIYLAIGYYGGRIEMYASLLN